MTLLIFDCDGVLVDSEILHAQVEAEVGKDLLGIDRDLWEHHRLFTGGGLKRVYDSWEKQIGKPLPFDLDEEMARRKEQAFTTKLTAMPYVAEALRELPGISRCVASGTPLPTLAVALRTAKLYEFFAPNLFSGDMVKRPKPAPDLFRFAAERMGAKPEDCLVIEDSVRGVEAAIAAHMPVIGFVGGSHYLSGEAAKLEGTIRNINDMRDLPALVWEHCLGESMLS